MTIVSSKLPLLNAGRQKIQDVGLRNTRVLIRTRTWSGSDTGYGTATDIDVELLPRPKVQQIEGVVASSRGSVVISRITPAHVGGGYDPDDLILSQPAGTEVFVVLIGPTGRESELRIVEIGERSVFGYSLHCEDRK